MARALVSACFVMSGCLAFSAPAQRAEAAAGAADDVQDLFFLGGAQPLLVRFHIQIGDRPLTTAWRDAVANLHEYLDFNGAGTVGRDEELADLVPMLRGPLGVRTLPASPSESGLDTTFARLDANGDGKLGPEEREQAVKSLRRFDQNDDEAISSAELSAFRDPNSDAMAQETRGNAEAAAPVLLLDRSGSRIRAVQQVLSRFDTGGSGGARAKDHRLGRSEIRLAAEVFRRVRQEPRRSARQRRADGVSRPGRSGRRADRPARPATGRPGSRHQAVQRRGGRPPERRTRPPPGAAACGCCEATRPW